MKEVRHLIENSTLTLKQIAQATGKTHWSVQQELATYPDFFRSIRQSSAARQANPKQYLRACQLALKDDLEGTIRRLIETTERTLYQIAESLGVALNTVRRVYLTYPAKYRKTRQSTTLRNCRVGEGNPMYGVKGADHHSHKGLVGDNKGYLMVLKPEWYTGRKNSRHVFHHHVVVCENLGLTAIPKGWHVHHVDFDRHNNLFENLVLIESGDHIRLHKYLRDCATTISKESTLKWVEAHGTPWKGQ